MLALYSSLVGGHLPKPTDRQTDRQGANIKRLWQYEGDRTCLQPTFSSESHAFFIIPRLHLTTFGIFGGF